MADGIFFRFKNTKSDLELSDEFIYFLVSYHIFLNGPKTFENIIYYLSDVLDYKGINNNKFKAFLRENFYFKKYLFSNYEENDIKMRQVYDYIFEFTEALKDDKQTLIRKIRQSISEDDFMMTYVNAEAYDKLFGLKENINIYYYYIYKILDTKLIDDINEAIKDIDSFYDDMELGNLFTSDIFSSAIYLGALNNINTIKDLKESNDSAKALFGISIDFALITINALNKGIKEVIETFTLDLFKEFRTIEIIVVKYRNNYFGEDKTLEELGKENGLTRERIRQIEAKAKQKLLTYQSKINLVTNNLFNYLVNDGLYVDRDTLYDYIKKIDFKFEAFTKDATISLDSESVARIILFYAENGDSNVKYDRHYRILYDGGSFDKEDIINEELSKIDKELKEEDVKRLNSFEKVLIEDNYRKVRSGLYLYKGMLVADIYLNVMSRFFKDGYHASSEEDYNLLKEKYEELYGESDNYPSERAIVGYIERSSYVLIDRGTYKDADYCASLDDELKDRILAYIEESGPTVYYLSIYEKFKAEVNDLGINNHYYLKGLIDKFLPEDYKSKRDYLMTNSERISSKEAVLNHIKSFNKEFSLEDLRLKFPGVKDYVFFNSLYDEMANGLLFTSGKSFIWFNNLNVDQEMIDDLRRCIEDTFDSLNSEEISAKSVYLKLNDYSKDLLNIIKDKGGQFLLFSLIYYLFDNYYYFRPTISKHPLEEKGRYSIIKNKAIDTEMFNLKIIQEYTNKLGFINLYSYLEFMEDMSDSHVQVDKDMMIRKDKFDIDYDILAAIKETLNTLIDSFKEIDTRIFKAYAILPNVKRPWNKYLLVGIIRSYLSDYFYIENTEATYNKTDFIIRKIGESHE